MAVVLSTRLGMPPSRDAAGGKGDVGPKLSDRGSSIGPSGVIGRKTRGTSGAVHLFRSARNGSI